MEVNENKLPENQEGLTEGVQGTPELSNASENQPEEVVAEAPAAETPAVVASAAPEEADDHGHDEVDEEDEDLKLLDSLHFDNPTKDELYAALKKVSHMKNMRALDQALKEIKPLFDHLYETERDAALKAFLAAGNETDDFDYKGEEVDGQFSSLYDNLRHKKQKYYAELERSKDDNLKLKNEILEKLRVLVDGEESTTSINALKTLQEEWKKVGPIPGAHVKTMWASYNALIDRFYDNRSIYFELKELDRRKNLEGKLDICARAEELVKMENIKEAIVQLNDLHEEFKHLGPVPKDDQEVIWQRFKTASDKVYSKRKDFFDHLKKELTDNADKKMALGDSALEFATFKSDKISDWNKKTKQLLELQKKWEEVGGLPRESAKHVNKHFWANFKQFFANKSAFFKALEGEREANLKAKQALLDRVLELQASNEWDKTAGELKKLQNQWREIGPVPEKYRNEIYDKFKAACDQFFERKRAKGNAQNQEFEQNLKRKEEICNMLDAYLNSDTIELEEVYGLLDQYAEVGFVPRNAIKDIHDRFDEVTDKFLALEELSDEQRVELQTQIQISKLRNSPHGAQKINRKESAIKRRISQLESDIATFKTNMDFFAQSKNADRFKEDIKNKIVKAQEEIQELHNQLNILNQI